MKKGKLIVLEGIDGSGKSSQYRRLCARMEKDNIAYNHIVFPRYDKDSSALIRMYLGGQFGSNPSDVNAYAASTFYAVDRFASYREDWGKIYEEGGIIISDRYTTSNAVHQGCKLSDEELPGFFSWLADLEYVKMGLPEPDLVIYLDVDIETSLRRMKHRQEGTNTKADIHEKDVAYLERCLRTADKAAEHYGWKRIPFMKDGLERETDEKNDEIYSIILETLGNI
jgi:dTMP kinase